MPPFYDWQCKNCENKFETMTSFSEFERWRTDKHIPCPKCASCDVEKLISTGTSYQYKGKGGNRMDGWYGKSKKS